MNLTQLKRYMAQVIDDQEDAALLNLEPFYSEGWTNPAAADPDGIVESFASSASEDVRSGAELDGAVGAGTMSPPRNITITTTSHADIDAVGVVVAGLDIDGNALTETITLTNGGNTTDVGVKAFASVTSITIPAQSGTGGALTIGFGAGIGLAKKIRSVAGQPIVLSKRESTAGDVIAGAVTTAAVGAPNGLYTPNTAPDASEDYAITYLIDPD